MVSMRIGKGVVEADAAPDVVLDVALEVLVDAVSEAELGLALKELELGVDMHGQTVVVAKMTDVTVVS